LGLPLLTGCEGVVQQPPNGWATLPADAVAGAGDPVRAAILNAAFVFGNPASVAGNPAQAARAVANYEFLTVEIPYGPRWRGFNPNVSTELAEGLKEVQSFVGINPAAPTQQVINALFAASRALQAGDQAAAERVLAPPTFPAGGAPTLQRLSALPLLPRANAASSLAASELDREGRLGSPRGGGPGGGGGGGGGRP
jgi:hypothetical protein